MAAQFALLQTTATRRLSSSLRRFVEREATPNVEKWRRRDRAAGVSPQGRRSRHIPLGLSSRNTGGVSEEIDAFHRLVLVDETARTGAGGIQAGF
jgi:acyl-CoA dehydrogenase